MSDYSDPMKNYASAGAQDLPRLIEKSADALGISGETEKVETFGEALARHTWGHRPRRGRDHGSGRRAGLNITVDQQRALSGVSIRLS
jgi:hypothetical protein